MNFKKIQNQRGWGLSDVIFWVLVIAVLAWLARQYLLHPEGLAPRPATHSQWEDSK